MVEPEKPMKKKDQIAMDKEDNTQAIMDVDFQLAQQMQTKEQEQLSIDESQQFNEARRYDEIQEMFDKEMKRVNTFVDMNTKLVKSSETRTEGSSKRAGDELESDKSKKQI
ncbi:hypothetical protein Tco_1002048 [Tanacetum coccineum]|uniref:Uncharacterized protein n=1 Tax=Tanacetum coccineum TaxID=301880 RepID=A0ABQ5F6J3_9ASTR